MLIVLGHVLAIHLIRNCRTIQVSVRILIQNLCFIDVIAGLWGVLRSSFQAYISAYPDVFCSVEVFVMTTILNVSVFLVTGITIDRYWSIFYPMVYTRHDSKSVCKVCCVAIWAAGIFLAMLVPINGLTYTENIYCGTKVNAMDNLASWIMAIVKVICILIICIANFKIVSKAREVGKIYFSGSGFEIKSVIKLFCIILPHFALDLVDVVSFFVCIAMNKSFLLLPLQSHLVVIVIIVDLWGYVFRFHECRVNLMIFLCRWSSKRRDQYIKRRQNILVSFLTDGTRQPTISVVTTT